MRPADKERFTALVAWATSHGASLHPALEIYQDEATGFSLRVKPDHEGPEAEAEAPSVKAQDELLACPLEISLSYLNAHTGRPLSPAATTPDEADEARPSSPRFPPAFLSAAAPHVVGRFFLMQQYLLGRASFWHPYIATLPQPDAPASWALPPFWPATDTAFLAGTNAGIAAATVRAQLKAEFKRARALLQDDDDDDDDDDDAAAAWQDYTRPLYHWASSIFTSRSFRTSRVLPAAAIAAIPPGVAVDDFSVLLPVVDILNHRMQAQVEWLATAAAGDECARVCRFRTRDAYPPGAQVFLSYGDKTNSELLLSYGFVLPATAALHNDYVHVRTRGRGAGAGVAPASPVPPPQDFLVALRPMDHPSSFVGRARAVVAARAAAEGGVKPGFAHVEDALVWELCLMVVGGANRAAFVAAVLGDDAGPEQDRAAEGVCLGRILSPSGALPGEVCEVVGQVEQLLLGKLGMEYDKLLSMAPGVGVDEDGHEVVTEVTPQNGNQKIALLYRSQVRKVLENAIGVLAPDWQEELEQP